MKINKRLMKFLIESNGIEGIDSLPTTNQLQVAQRFLSLETIELSDVVGLVAAFQPDAVLRIRRGMDVQVGGRTCPRGGPYIKDTLDEILWGIGKGELENPCDVHRLYEVLHPFTDGNGRSGRMIWLWQMVNQYRGGGWPELSFLHTFYYQTLERVSYRSGVVR